MKEMCRSLAMAFSMFSVLPMPKVEWKQENMRYMLAFLPMVGLVIALGLWGFYHLCALLQSGNLFFAAGLTLLPVLLSGGIHLDGFCDTADALSSHGDPERKRAILKDPHTGAFALIYGIGWFLLFFACCTELPRTEKAVWALGLQQALARCFGSLAAVLFPGAGGNGSLALFRQAADKKAAALLVLQLLLFGGILLYLFPWAGAAALGIGLLCLLSLYFMCRREFGGMSGDLAGFIITFSQALMALGFVLTERVVALCC